ncbi:hypothetical protein RFI_34712 [Reticulomyxa filosa]|uniref:Uncharacterized protein n=1 Tax=Reticulomyxa filosa TaxID=46433 RepID=X6LPP0_RETFI|nr:hypothetical protein RFI_34712 [Reticulomyxa filosa]|eukprot:ETO02705.1 hypothetical protein RFI_34712 [Reticulomyxa filosa]
MLNVLSQWKFERRNEEREESLFIRKHFTYQLKLPNIKNGRNDVTAKDLERDTIHLQLLEKKISDILPWVEYLYSLDQTGMLKYKLLALPRQACVYAKLPYWTRIINDSIVSTRHINPTKCKNSENARQYLREFIRVGFQKDILSLILKFVDQREKLAKLNYVVRRSVLDKYTALRTSKTEKLSATRIMTRKIPDRDFEIFS